jgi:pre-mRNA cleavage complex 2 protein Pcf11
MSYYSQHYPSSYGMPSQSYAPPPPAHSGYSYGSYPAQQPQPPPFQADPVQFRREFAHRLSELTVNSRPIIQGLSMMAHDCIRFADIVAECLEMHIRRVSHRLLAPVIYYMISSGVCVVVHCVVRRHFMYLARLRP